MLITPEYISLLRERFERGGDNTFGTSGHQWANAVHQTAVQNEVRTLLDYGAGRGTLRSALLEREPHYQIFEYDPAIEGKETKPLRADMVVCGDVLEHVEPDCLYAVMDDVQNIARSVVFFIIPVIPAKKTLADGRNAHLIVEPIEWWLPKLIQRWQPRLVSNMDLAFMYIGQRR